MNYLDILIQDLVISLVNEKNKIIVKNKSNQKLTKSIES